MPANIAIGLILASIAFGVGLSPLGGITLARVSAALFGAALIAVGIVAMLQNQNFGAASGRSGADHRQRPG